MVGFSIDVPTTPSLFKLTKPDVSTIWGDVRDLKKLKKTVSQEKPDIVFHLAAQPLVRASYIDPIVTFETNVLGTANLLEALRGSSVKAAVIVTTDKVYDNEEKLKAFKESDPLGGYDPYSASKAAAEIIIASYRNSFFNAQEYGKGHTTLIASVRAGNVIGGGDFAKDRLVPDFVRAILSKKELKVRHPKAIRPWQHVLESLSGYLMLAQELYLGQKEFATSFNLGPQKSDIKSVEWIVKKLCAEWGSGAWYSIAHDKHVHEAHYLRLDIAKAQNQLGWTPRWKIEEALGKIVDWTRDYQAKKDMRAVCHQQIKEYSKSRQS